MINQNPCFTQPGVNVFFLSLFRNSLRAKSFLSKNNIESTFGVFSLDNINSGLILRDRFDMVVVLGNRLKKNHVLKIRCLLKRIGFDYRKTPVFGLFGSLTAKESVFALRKLFYDVRKVNFSIERSNIKINHRLRYWAENVSLGGIRILRLNRLKFFEIKLRDSQSWVRREFFQIQNQLFRIQHVVDSMEMWQQGRRLDRELKIARVIQSSLLPKRLPSFDGFDFDAVCVPAKEIGGDFFDYFHISKTKLGFIIGDAATRGIPAALLMTEIRGIWRALMMNAQSTNDVVTKINSLLCDDLKNMLGLYVTLFCGIIDSEDQKIFFTNAGHCYPVVYKQSEGKIIELSDGGKVLGISMDGFYEIGEVSVTKDDLILCYTDGITESRKNGGEFFGKERLYEIVKRNCQYSVKYIRETIFNQIDDFTGISDSHDDKALFLFKCL